MHRASADGASKPEQNKNILFFCFTLHFTSFLVKFKSVLFIMKLLLMQSGLGIEFCLAELGRAHKGCKDFKMRCKFQVFGNSAAVEFLFKGHVRPH